jgi:hypothetical protein
MGASPPLIACSLDGDGQQTRLGEWKDLLAKATAREETDSGVNYSFPGELEARVQELAAAEHECCAFLEFELTRRDDRIELSVAAPPDGLDALRVIFA